MATDAVLSSIITHTSAIITRAEKVAVLEKNLVSNRTSAVINQITGCLIGCILLFLALLLNFQDNAKDMLILNLMGYTPSLIRKTLIDLYRHVVCVFFLIGIWPSTQIVKVTLKSLSLQIGDYMPFKTNLFVIILTFIFLNALYMLVQFTFNLGIKKVIKSDQIYTYASNE